MSTVIRPKENFPTNAEPGGKGILDYLRPFAVNTVGAKLLVAVTGLMLTGFVIAHLVGNLNVFAGQDAINNYALFLKKLGPLLWLARIGLLVVFLVHVLLVIKLKSMSAAARPIAYLHGRTVQASAAGRYMLLTGLVVLAFLLFHLAHFTFGWVKGADVGGYRVNYLDLRDSSNAVEGGRHDVYSMVVYGFQNTVITVLYVVAQLALFLHLSHGFQSAFQTLGANSPRWQQTWRRLGYAVALLLLVGNVGIAGAIWAGALQPTPDITNTLAAAGLEKATP